VPLRPRISGQELRPTPQGPWGAEEQEPARQRSRGAEGQRERGRGTGAEGQRGRGRGAEGQGQRDRGRGAEGQRERGRGRGAEGQKEGQRGQGQGGARGGGGTRGASDQGCRGLRQSQLALSVAGLLSLLRELGIGDLPKPRELTHSRSLLARSQIPSAVRVLLVFRVRLAFRCVKEAPWSPLSV